MSRSNGFSQQQQQQPRNPSDASHPSVSVAPPSSNTSSMNRAQRFEDEKRRIIESCFAKTDDQGQLAESYITHLRIIEDAAHPSSPPPAESPADNKKPRVIIVAVRSTGRVRMHKARENNNGSFSIGKTWNLEDLSAIESFAHPSPQAEPRYRQYAEWAGQVGFTVTIAKPYYWQAGTPKERDFFIASLVKIFRKYTKGRMPDLLGFDQQERESMFAPLPPQQASRRPSEAPSRATPPPQQLPFAQQPRPASPAQSSFAQQARPLSPALRDPRQRVIAKDQPSMSASRRHPSLDLTARSTTPVSAPETRVEPKGPSEESVRRLRQAASRERMRKSPSRENVRAQSRDGRRSSPDKLIPARAEQGRLSPTLSKSEMLQPSHSPDPSTIPTDLRPVGVAARAPSPQPTSQSPSRQQSFQSAHSSHSVLVTDPLATNGNAMYLSTQDRWKPQGARQQDQPVISPIEQRPATAGSYADSVDMRETAGTGEVSRSFLPETQLLPERRRPPLGSRNNTNDLRPPPLSTSRSASATGRPSSPPVGKLPGAFYDSPRESESPHAPSQPSTTQGERQFSFTKSPVVEQEPNAVPGAFASSPAVTTPVATTPDVLTPDYEKSEEEMHRPGLGPMIKKRARGDVANTFRKAATAYNAFKPRAGGAGERLASARETSSQGEADGITGVVPAPLRTTSDNKNKFATPEPSPTVEVRKTLSIGGPDQLPKVEPATAASPRKATPQEAQLVDGIVDERVAALPVPDEDVEPSPAPAPEPRKPKRRSQQQEKYLAALGIDSRLLDGRGLDFENILADFGWTSDKPQRTALDDLEVDLRRELGRVEAGSWLGHLEQKDERVGMVDRLLDRAIAECDELEGLLTLYSVELGTLNEDISFIEAQSQGLQVQTANQKILHAELQNLVDTISITPDQLHPLKRGDFGNLEEIEASLLLLYKAMTTIDPTIRSSNALSSSTGAANQAIDNGERNQLSNMAALREKREAYLDESSRFCQRLVNRLGGTFDSTLKSALPSLTRSSAGVSASPYKLNIAAYNASRASLWQFSPLVLYTKEVNQPAWNHLLGFYNDTARPLYNEVLKTSLSSYKSAVRKPTGVEADLLFTSVEQETNESLTNTARKLTVKRSQTLAKTFRSASGEKSINGHGRQAGRMMPCEVFAGVLDEWGPMMSTEQNFVVAYFHATSLENYDFADAVVMQPPRERRGPELAGLKLTEPDRGVAGHVSRAMERTFEFWPAELRVLIEWCVAGDPLQGVGILTTIAVHSAPLHESSQEWLLRTLGEASFRLQTQFQKFVEDQIRAIEDTKVKIKKRKGVIAFMKVFPPFATVVESIFAGAAGTVEGLSTVREVRHLLDDSYERINKAMWDSLTQIAKASPTAGSAGAGQGADSEDKEKLNYHIMLIENMNHYIEEVDEGSKEGSVLVKWKSKALMDRAEHMEEYVKRVVRRPLGKVLDFLDSAGTRKPDPSVAARPSHSRSAAKKLLAAHDSKEIRRGIDTLRKRIEKHFGEGDDETLSRKLVGLVCSECEREYERVLNRVQEFCRDVYREEEKSVDIDWSKEDIVAGFRR